MFYTKTILNTTSKYTALYYSVPMINYHKFHHEIYITSKDNFFRPLNVPKDEHDKKKTYIDT